MGNDGCQNGYSEVIGIFIGSAKVPKLCVFILFLWATSDASAAWRVAETDNFVIYANAREGTIRKQAERLERYHCGLSLRFGLKECAKLGRLNRLTIFVVKNAKEMRELYGDDGRYVGAFYIPRAGRSVAFAQKLDVGKFAVEGNEASLFHEYAHHFMFNLANTAYPLWFSEGFAEFYSAAAFDKEGGVIFGRPAKERFYELQVSRQVPIEVLVDTQRYRKWRKKSVYDSFYGQSWLLFHYLQFAAERKGQLRAYLELLKGDISDTAAAQEAFGDLWQLQKEMYTYLNQNRLNALLVSADRFVISDISVRKLTNAEAAILPAKLRSERGVDDVEAVEVVQEAEKVASKYTESASVWEVLAEARFDVDDFQGTLDAADRALEIDPLSVRARIYRSYAYTELAMQDQSAESWSQVSRVLEEHLEFAPDHPIFLREFYLYFTRRGNPPSSEAVERLKRALYLAPYDDGLRLLLAQQFVRDRNFAEAIVTLDVIASNSHSRFQEEASRLRDLAIKQLENSEVEP
ncbi:MAG: DUF1570 domain-containing protein [Pseudomonadota bacterium]